MTSDQIAHYNTHHTFRISDAGIRQTHEMNNINHNEFEEAIEQNDFERAMQTLVQDVERLKNLNEMQTDQVANEQGRAEEGEKALHDQIERETQALVQELESLKITHTRQSGKAGMVPHRTEESKRDVHGVMECVMEILVEGLQHLKGRRQMHPEQARKESEALCAAFKSEMQALLQHLEHLKNTHKVNEVELNHVMLWLNRAEKREKARHSELEIMKANFMKQAAETEERTEYLMDMVNCQKPLVRSLRDFLDIYWTTEKER